MELTLQVFLIVCPLIFLAGFIDSIAGGGGLISLPAYMIAGLPPHFAMGTNKLSSVMGIMVAFMRYYRNKYADILLCLPSIPAALIGSAMGSSFVLSVDEQIIRWMLIAVIPVTAFFIFRKKNLDDTNSRLSRNKTVFYSVIISFIIGIYGGFAGPGTGTFLILLYNGVAKIDARTANGNAKLINFTVNLSALIVFFVNGRVLVPLGLCAGLFNMLGAYIGSGLVIKKGSKIIRYALFIVLGLVFVKLIWDTIAI